MQTLLNFAQYRFDGQTFDPKQDGMRLTRQLDRVYEFMAVGSWITLPVLAQLTGCSEASASARLRDLRKARFGAHTIERRRVEGGLFEYRMVPK